MRSIILSKRASNKLNKLLEYLDTEWSKKVKIDFIKKLDKALSQIQKHPDSCQKSDAVIGLHMMIVTKQTSLFYRYDSKRITIVTLFDNRMDPSKLKKENQ